MAEQTQFEYDVAPRPNHILVLEHPTTKNHHIGMRQLEQLVKESELPWDKIQTVPDTEETLARIYQRLEPTDLFYIIGGDGTVNTALEPAMNTGALLLPSKSGNANDGPNAFNGGHVPGEAYSHYKHGRINESKIHPLVINIDGKNRQESRYALNYISMGYAALASFYIDQPWEHPLIKKYLVDDRSPRVRAFTRLPHEGMMLKKAARDVQPFNIEWLEGENTGETNTVSDISLVHSEIMAKFGRFNVRHIDPYAFASVLTEMGTLALGKEFVKMMQGKMIGKNVTKLAFLVESPEDSIMFYQVDGEAHTMPSRISTVDMSISEKIVRVLAMKFNQFAPQNRIN